MTNERLGNRTIVRLKNNNKFFFFKVVAHELALIHDILGLSVANSYGRSSLSEQACTPGMYPYVRGLTYMHFICV